MAYYVPCIPHQTALMLVLRLKAAESFLETSRCT